MEPHPGCLHKGMAVSPGLASQEARAMREARRHHVLDQNLRQMGHPQAEAMAAPKTARWNLLLPQGMRTGAVLHRHAWPANWDSAQWAPLTR